MVSITLPRSLTRQITHRLTEERAREFDEVIHVDDDDGEQDEDDENDFCDAVDQWIDLPDQDTTSIGPSSVSPSSPPRRYRLRGGRRRGGGKRNRREEDEEETILIPRSFYETLAARAGESVALLGNAAKVAAGPMALLNPAVAGLISTGGAAAAVMKREGGDGQWCEN